MINKLESVEQKPYSTCVHPRRVLAPLMSFTISGLTSPPPMMLMRSHRNQRNCLLHRTDEQPPWDATECDSLEKVVTDELYWAVGELGGVWRVDEAGRSGRERARERDAQNKTKCAKSFQNCVWLVMTYSLRNDRDVGKFVPEDRSASRVPVGRNARMALADHLH